MSLASGKPNPRAGVFFDTRETWADICSLVRRRHAREGDVKQLVAKTIATAQDGQIISIRAGDLRTLLTTGEP
jgi:hypothetical protein